MISYTDEEIAADRLDSLGRLTESYDESIEEVKERYLNEIGYHEVLHTSHIFMENVEQYLLTHPAVIFDKEAYSFAHEAHTSLFNLYQRLGELRFAKDEPSVASGEPVVAAVESSAEASSPPKEPPRRWYPWYFIHAHLDHAGDIPDSLKEQIRRTLEIFMDDDDDQDAVPNSGSFAVLLKFLGEHPELPPPALGINPEGMFCAIWQTPTNRWSLVFSPWAGLHDPNTKPGSVREQSNIQVTEVVSVGDIGVELIHVSIDEIKIPTWVKEAK